MKVHSPPFFPQGLQLYIDGLVQERRNSSALAMELSLSYTNTVALGDDNKPLPGPIFAEIYVATRLHYSTTI